MPIGVALLTVFSAYFSNERVPKMGMPFGLNVACSGVTFIYLGHLVRVLFDKAPKLIDSKVIIAVSIIVLVIIGSLFFELNGVCNHLTAMSYGKYGNYICFILSSVLLGSATLLIALLIENPLFAKYGKLTLPIYAFHLLAVGAVNMIYSHTVELLFESYNLRAVAVGTVSLIITCAIIPIIRGVDSNLIGEHK